MGKRNGFNRPKQLKDVQQKDMYICTPCIKNRKQRREEMKLARRAK